MPNVAVTVVLKTSKKTCEVPARKLTGMHQIFLNLRICLLLNRSRPGTRLVTVFRSIHRLSILSNLILKSQSHLNSTHPYCPMCLSVKQTGKKKNLQAKFILKGQVVVVL